MDTIIGFGEIGLPVNLPVKISHAYALEAICTGDATTIPLSEKITCALSSQNPGKRSNDSENNRSL